MELVLGAKLNVCKRLHLHFNNFARHALDLGEQLSSFEDDAIRFYGK